MKPRRTATPGCVAAERPVHETVVRQGTIVRRLEGLPPVMRVPSGLFLMGPLLAVKVKGSFDRRFTLKGKDEIK